MAKINFGGLAQDVRGSQNGLTYARNRGGAYVRRKVTPVNPRSIRQSQVRASFGANSKAWSGALTQSQRDAWTNFGAANPVTDIFGLAITLTGQQTYQRLNQVLNNIGSASELDPPADLSVSDLAAVTGFTVDTDMALNVTVNTESQAVVADTAYYIFMTAGQAAGKVPNESAYRFVAAVPAAGSSTVIDLSDEYGALFGTPSVGQGVWMIVARVNTATGAVTPGLKFQTFAT